ncbi:MAG: DUF3309 domain-containing protein [Rhizobiaceae bacterium]|nr:DUF3309 domain-containing protein [Rhizobiaceae bacterium]
MTFGPILAIIVLTMLLGSLPLWPWSRGWTNRPAILLVILLATIVIAIALQII